MDFPFLLSCNAAAGACLQFGLSASAPLLINRPGHFLQHVRGLMPLSTTIWTPATLVYLAACLTSVFILARLLMPKNVWPISLFPDARALADKTLNAAAQPPEKPARSDRFDERLEANRLPCGILMASLFGWLLYHVFVRGGGVKLNSLTTALLAFGLLLHGSVLNLTRAPPRAVRL